MLCRCEHQIERKMNTRWNAKNTNQNTKETQKLAQNRMTTEQKRERVTQPRGPMRAHISSNQATVYIN